MYLKQWHIIPSLDLPPEFRNSSTLKHITHLTIKFQKYTRLPQMEKYFLKICPLKIKIRKYLETEWNFLNLVNDVHQHPF